MKILFFFNVLFVNKLQSNKNAFFNKYNWYSRHRALVLNAGIHIDF